MADPTASTSGSSESPLSAIVSSLPLSWPIPNPARDESIVPSADISLEQDLLLNQDSLRAWTSYIRHVENANYHRRSPPDIQFNAEEARLLGPLSSSNNRLALRRIVSIYERALVLFPTSYALHRDYLYARARFVLGEPKGGYEALRKRINASASKSLDAGPSLVEEQDDDEWKYGWQDGGALDGTVGHKEWAALIAACERSLQWFPRMPRLHLFYLSIFLHPLCPAPLYLTHARRTFDRSLRLLPPSLHLRIWKVYLRWAERVGGETGLRVWRRYLSVDPSLTERYVKMLLGSVGEDEEDEPNHETARKLEAAKLLLGLATDAANGKYTSPEGKAPHQLLIEWLDLVEEYPDDVGLDEDDEHELQKAVSKGDESSSQPAFPRPQDTTPLDASLLPVRSILLATLDAYPDQAGRLWTGLATYHLKKGELDLAKQTFDDGMKRVVTVRDFSVIFDAYAESQEGVMSYLMSELEEGGGGDDDDNADDSEREEKEADLDARMQAFEALMESRPFLVNDVMLRRNPDDVQEWEKRVALHGDDDDEGVVGTYRKAVETINARKATANLHQLYLNFARFYEMGGSRGLALLRPDAEIPTDDEDLPLPDLPSARAILEKATTVPYKRVDDLAEVWIAWAEMEIRHGEYDLALRVMSRATAVSGHTKPSKVSYHDDSLPPQSRLFKSLKLWSFYSDLEESIGSTEGAKRVYDRILELKIANAQTIINYASFLEERGYHEDAFRVYERGVESFGYPVAFELWNVYLGKFIARYKGSKIERARDLFEQALAGCPAEKFAKVLFIKYGLLEEEYGLARRALKVYARACEAVSDAEKFEMYTFYIAKTASSFGLPATRAIYETAIQSLPDRSSASLCLRFASLERKLGEIDRARAIYKYASQFCDPRLHVNFWREWNSFEVEHGSEDTFREMLRVKRSTMALYNTETSYLAASARQGGDPTASATATGGDAMDQVARSSGVAATGMFVGATTERGGGKKGKEEADAEEGERGPARNAEMIGDAGGSDDDDDEDLM